MMVKGVKKRSICGPVDLVFFFEKKHIFFIFEFTYKKNIHNLMLKKTFWVQYENTEKFVILNP